MIWHSAADFFNMGGYGLYVWGSYIATAAVMALDPWMAARRRRRALAGLVDAIESPHEEPQR